MAVLHRRETVVYYSYTEYPLRTPGGGLVKTNYTPDYLHNGEVAYPGDAPLEILIFVSNRSFVFPSFVR